jgi:uncharacterized protein (TIGR03643 family)
MHGKNETFNAAKPEGLAPRSDHPVESADQHRGGPEPMALSEADISRVIEMAWEDRTPFEAIEAQFGLNEAAVTKLMRSQMTGSSFRMWRTRMASRITKHRKLYPLSALRHRATNTRQA